MLRFPSIVTIAALALGVAACSDAAEPPVDDRAALFTAAYPSQIMLARLGGAARAVRALEVGNDPSMVGFPALSPDGERLAYLTQTSAGISLMVGRVDDDAAGDVVIAASTWGYARPVWAPDGRRLAYAAQDVNDIVLYMVDPSLGPPVEIARIAGGSSGRWLYVPAWSPSGDAIAFSTTYGLGVYSLIDRQVRTLVAGTTYPLVGEPSWSPDGLAIAVVRSSTISELAVVSPSNGSVTPLVTRPNDSPAHPRWSPDGRSIAYTDNGGDAHASLQLIDRSGGAPRTLAAGEYGAWSADGSELLYASVVPDPRGADPTLEILHVDDGTHEPLPYQPRMDEGGSAAWVPSAPTATH